MELSLLWVIMKHHFDAASAAIAAIAGSALYYQTIVEHLGGLFWLLDSLVGDESPSHDVDLFLTNEHEEDALLNPLPKLLLQGMTDSNRPPLSISSVDSESIMCFHQAVVGSACRDLFWSPLDPIFRPPVYTDFLGLPIAEYEKLYGEDHQQPSPFLNDLWLKHHLNAKLQQVATAGGLGRIGKLSQLLEEASEFGTRLAASIAELRRPLVLLVSRSNGTTSLPFPSSHLFSSLLTLDAHCYCSCSQKSGE